MTSFFVPHSDTHDDENAGCADNLLVAEGIVCHVGCNSGGDRYKHFQMTTLLEEGQDRADEDAPVGDAAEETGVDEDGHPLVVAVRQYGIFKKFGERLLIGNVDCLVEGVRSRPEEELHGIGVKGRFEGAIGPSPANAPIMSPPVVEEQIIARISLLVGNQRAAVVHDEADDTDHDQKTG